MAKFNIGDICIIDPNNKLNVSGNNIIYIKITKVYGFYIFKICQGLICNKNGEILNETPIEINARNLVPMNTKGDNIVIRYPSDTPILKQNDVDIVKVMYDISADKLTNDQKINAVKLIAKLEFFSKIINEY